MKNLDNDLINLFLRYEQNPAFLEQEPIKSVHQRGAMNETLLNLAVIAQDKKDVLLLLKNGADVNAAGELNFTAIQNACISQNMEIIKILIQRGANIFLKNELGYDALHYAKSQDKMKSKEILTLLKEKYEKTPVH